MPDSLEQRAAAFLALAEKATEGPWTRRPGGKGVMFPYDKVTNEHAEANASLMIAARNDAPALVADLLAEVRRLRGEEVKGA
mgnify:CR=1 FL=1